MSDYTAIKQQLEEMLSVIESRVKRIDAKLRTAGDDDWEERAIEIEGNDVLSGLGNLGLEEMRQIKHALHQIETGQYGKCEVCGKRIQVGRLEALPFATTCAACAS